MRPEYIQHYILDHPSGLRYLMHRHPWISAVFGVGSNLAMLVMIILVSWTRFLTGDSGSRTNRREEATEEDEGHQEEEIENMGASSGNNDNVETLPPPPPASRGILRSLIRSLVINLIQLLIFVTICLVSMNAYQHETYEASKLYEITANQIREFVTSEKRLEDIQTLKKIILG